VVIENRFTEVQDAFRNLAPKNPTQTMYTRFVKMPTGDLKTSFTEAFKSTLDTDRLKTRYSSIMEGTL